MRARFGRRRSSNRFPGKDKMRRNEDRDNMGAGRAGPGLEAGACMLTHRTEPLAFRFDRLFMFGCRRIRLACIPAGPSHLIRHMRTPQTVLDSSVLHSKTTTSSKRCSHRLFSESYRGKQISSGPPNQLKAFDTGCRRVSQGGNDNSECVHHVHPHRVGNFPGVCSPCTTPLCSVLFSFNPQNTRARVEPDFYYVTTTAGTNMNGELASSISHRSAVALFPNPCVFHCATTGCSGIIVSQITPRISDVPAVEDGVFSLPRNVAGGCQESHSSKKQHKHTHRGAHLMDLVFCMLKTRLPCALPGCSSTTRGDAEGCPHAPVRATVSVHRQ